MQKLNILVVEDNPGDFLLIQEYLEEYFQPAQLEHVKNFRDAELILTSGDKYFDVILLDLSLPDKGGEILINNIVMLGAGATVIVLTGYENLDFSIKSLSLGVSDYLVKDDISATSLYKSILYNIERRKTNLQLEESEKRYSDLFHLSPQPMWVYELETLKFLDVNQMAITDYGYSKEEFLQMTIRDIRPEEDLPVLENALKNLKHKVAHSTTGRYRHKKKNGNIIRVDLQAVSIHFNGKEAEIVVTNDITNISSYIEAINEQNKKFREIAWIQSHVVRAPLARVMALTEMLKNPVILEIEKNQVLEFLVQSAKELDEIIRDISSKTYAANTDTSITF